MLQELVTEQTPVTSYRSREVQRFPHLLDIADDVEQYPAVKTLQIRLLGDFLLLANNSPLSSLYEVPRLQSLLSNLALHRGMPLSRSRVAFTLWPDSTDGQAHTNLRNLLFKLRAAVPEVDTFLLVDRQTLCWQPDTRWSLDVQDFERAVAQAAEARRRQDAQAERQALEAAMQHYRGDLLPGCYDEWISEERERLRHLSLSVLELLIELLEEAGRQVEAIRVAQRLLRLDPLQESTYRLLMRLYAARRPRLHSAHLSELRCGLTA
jgi:DNA-binding SARP family transcriptional activator